MISIDVHASGNYEVKVGSGLLDGLGQATGKATKAQTAVIISDSNVWPLYGKQAKNSLLSAGIQRVLHYIFDAGEQSKNASTWLSILEFLAENQVTRTDCIIALGGGVVGDMAGFAAACYLRGIDYIQVPTTLLAAVDSSVGGKTAIDLAAGKNLAGAFYQPRLVLCDTDTLNTLPQDIFRDGCAEVIKYGILYDRELFEHLKEKGLDFARETVIAQCIRLKRDVVMQDEFDRGARQFLNLGHTIGHGIEAQSKFTVSHGKAVSMGIAIASKAGAYYGICTDATCEQIRYTLERFGLPTATEKTAQEIYTSALSDKKRTGGTINLIVPNTIGHCVVHKTPVSELKAFIQAGL